MNVIEFSLVVVAHAVSIVTLMETRRKTRYLISRDRMQCLRTQLSARLRRIMQRLNKYA